MFFGAFIPLPFVILAAAIAAIGMGAVVSRTVVPALRKRRLRSRSHHWPAIEAHLDHACVTEYRPSDTIITFRLDAWFTYTVNGKAYEGNYEDEDMRLDDAKRLLSTLHHDPVIITYNPRKPTEYYYRPVRKRSA